MAIRHTGFATWQIILFVAVVLLFPAILFPLSGNWLWIEGWILTVWWVALYAAVFVYLYRHDPALLRERLRRPGTGGEKRWDTYWVYGVEVGFFAWLAIMPLDAQRYKWSPPFPLWAQAIGVIGLVLAFFFMYRAYVDNPFLSALVRIQTERAQHVVSTGVYSFVRHPVYLGGILMSIGAPLLLGSLYGVLIGIGMSFYIVARIIGEEKMLTAELRGYTEYKKRVRYRLIPFVW
jgi:protein-S-isoprenylcysteine O-methyltransferase Ste14